MERAYSWFEFYLANRRVEAMLETPDRHFRAAFRRAKVLYRGPARKLIVLHRLHVQRKYRGKGLSRRMLKHLCDWWDDHGYDAILSVNPHDKPFEHNLARLRLLYSSFGFEAVWDRGMVTRYMVRPYQGERVKR